MVDFGIVLQFVEFILCVLYDGIALIVIPDCIEAITFYAKLATVAHIDVREQIQNLKLVTTHTLLVLVVVNVTSTRFCIRTEEDLSQDRVSRLCNRCLQRERGREVRKGLLISEQMWLHRF